MHNRSVSNRPFINRWILCLILLAFGFSPESLAQTRYTLSEASTIVVEGKSNKSDWTVKAESYEGEIVLNDGHPSAATLKIPVDGMKSGRSMIMDRLMRSAFNAEEHPHIMFTMTKAEAGEEGALKVAGTLSMAGATNPVTVLLTKGSDDAGNIAYKGSSEVNMKDYGMDPPSAMFGSLLTKPEVMIQFNLVLQQ